MTKKIIACFVAALIILIPLQTNAEELQGTVTSLSLDEKAPYAGVLLDPIAASKMLVDQRYLRIEIELQLRKEFQKDLSEKRMAFDLLKIDYESLKKSRYIAKTKTNGNLIILLRWKNGNGIAFPSFQISYHK